MVFSSITFLFYFLPAVVLTYFLVPKTFRNFFLLAASLFFYAWGAPVFVFILCGTTVIDFYMVAQLHKANDSRIRKRWLVLSVALNLGLLAYFKYANFFVENVNMMLVQLGLGQMAWTEVLLPIGISFYTFQTLTYSIDVYRKVHPPLSKLTDYLMYIAMFPQLIAGPIVRFHEIADQLVQRSHSNEHIIRGFSRFSIGLAKKVLIANVLAGYADIIFNMDYASMASGTAWLGILCYTFQIYFDFAGYSDMAIGLGTMFGFRFPENFNAPYISKSITEFWRRWHITLSRFMKDYLYLPLGGNRMGAGRTYINLSLVFLLSGLWHGAHWNFVIWGAFHGFFLVVERLGKWPGNAVANFVGVPITFFLVVLGWVLFRIEDLAACQDFYLAMFKFSGGWPMMAHNAKLITFMLIAMVFSFLPLLPIGRRWMDHFYNANHNVKSVYGYFSLSVILFVWSVASLATGAFNPFIYFRF